MKKISLMLICLLIVSLAGCPLMTDGPRYVTVATNLPYYPLTGLFTNASLVRINGADEPLNENRSLFKVVALETGANSFTVQGVNDGGQAIGQPMIVEITYDPSINTESDSLLYVLDDRLDGSTIVINLTKDAVWGILPGISIWAATHDGKLAVDSEGRIYRTADHTPTGGVFDYPCPDCCWPKISQDDKYFYVCEMKFDFASQQLLRDDFPLQVDEFLTTILPTNIMVGNGTDTQGQVVARYVDLATDTVIAEKPLPENFYIWQTDPAGKYGFASTFGWGTGTLEVCDLDSMELVYQNEDMPDYLGRVAFSPDGKTAYIGCKFTGIYLYDLDSQELSNPYTQYGAFGPEVGEDGLIYVRSAYNNFWHEGTVSHQGIEVLHHNRQTGKLEFLKTYFLAADDDSYGNPIIIKPAA